MVGDPRKDCRSCRNVIHPLQRSHEARSLENLTMSLIGRANTIVTGVDEAIYVHGSDWLWTVTAIYVLSFASFIITPSTNPDTVAPDYLTHTLNTTDCTSSTSFAAKESERFFHYLFTFAFLVGAITYYAQASDLGWSAVEKIDHLDNGVVRQMFYAKFITWVVAFPSLALGLGLISGVSWTTIFCNIAIAWYWVISYLVSAYNGGSSPSALSRGSFSPWALSTRVVRLLLCWY